MKVKGAALQSVEASAAVPGAPVGCADSMPPKMSVLGPGSLLLGAMLALVVSARPSPVEQRGPTDASTDRPDGNGAGLVWKCGDHLCRFFISLSHTVTRSEVTRHPDATGLLPTRCF
ncbi:unnamed protein product [Lampetra planeri]